MYELVPWVHVCNHDDQVGVGSRSLINQGFCIFALPFERISALSKQHKSLGRMRAMIAMPHGFNL